MSHGVLGLSSMATKQLVADLAGLVTERHALPVSFRSAGGVEIAREVRAGARADLVVLGAGAMRGLDDDGLLAPGTLRPMFVSDVVAAVPETAEPPMLTDEADLRAALVGAGRLAYSTGPSGTALLELLERWGLLAELEDRLLQAPPGIPVGSLLARGEADLGFQQRSELQGLPGVRILGPLPGEAAIRSTFSGAVLVGSAQSAAAVRALDLLTAPDVADLVAAGGMTLA